MRNAERSVLHVLPHPGGGGETYVDILGDLPGYHADRVHLAHSPRPRPHELLRGVGGAFRHASGHDLLHVHGEVAGGLCLPLLATRPSVVTLHGLNLVRRLSGPRGTVAALNLRAVLRAADRTICVSESEREELVRAVGPGVARRAVVIRNGVRLATRAGEDERAETRRTLGIAESEVVGIWVGSLEEHKDPLAAVRAAQEASVTLLVVGDGLLRPLVERAADERVHVLGQRSDVPRLLAAADLYVLTSRREGLSLSLLEAMAHGLPVVVSDLPENVEAIGDAGICVRPDDGSFAAALRRLAADASERADVGARAAQRVSRFFGAAEMARRTRYVYDEVLAAGRSTAL
jgi:glycosyltransferase involved in cell wall biosynthesis